MVRYEQLEEAKLTPEQRRICDDCKAGPRSSVAPRWSTIGNGTHYWRLLLKLT